MRDEFAKTGGNIMQPHLSQGFEEAKTRLKHMKMNWGVLKISKNENYRPQNGNINELT